MKRFSARHRELCYLYGNSRCKYSKDEAGTMTMTKILNRITAHCENSQDYQAIRRGFMLMIPIVIISSFAISLS
jgi:hypothetical protein